MLAESKLEAADYLPQRRMQKRLFLREKLYKREQDIGHHTIIFISIIHFGIMGVDIHVLF